MKDLLVNLYDKKNDFPFLLKKLEETLPDLAGTEVSPAQKEEKDRTLGFVKAYYEENWVRECEEAFSNEEITCYLARRDGQIIGFACYDATAKGYFGPVGLLPEGKKKGVGRKLLYTVLQRMQEAGYGYAVIGWAKEAAGFYEKALRVWEIPDSETENTIYRQWAE